MILVSVPVLDISGRLSSIVGDRSGSSSFGSSGSLSSVSVSKVFAL